MRWYELYFWNSLFWVLYLPFSIGMYVYTDEGSIGGIVLIGMILSVFLTVFAQLADSIIDRMFAKKVAVVSVEPILEPVKVEPKKVEEVKDEKEPKPKMRTDVDLDRIGFT